MVDFIVNSGKKFSVGNYFWNEINPYYRKKAQFHGLIGCYKDVLVEKLDEFTVTNLCYFSIMADDYEPSYEVSDLSCDNSDLLEEKVNELLDLGILERTYYSDWSSPAYPKYIDDELDVCVNYKALNRITKTFYNLPSISDIHDSISQSYIFTKLVLKDAFHQLELDEKTTHMTAFETDFGTFQFATFHRGLKNAASCLQYTMDKVLEDIDDIQVYQGQVLVYSNSYEEHLSTLKECFAAFQSYNLKVDVDESLFLTSKLIFLGKEISKCGVGIAPNKLTSIASFPTPTSKTKLRSFLGLASQYDNYLPNGNFSYIAQPLYVLTSTHNNFYWSSRAENALRALKRALLTARPIPLQPY